MKEHPQKLTGINNQSCKYEYLQITKNFHKYFPRNEISEKSNDDSSYEEIEEGDGENKRQLFRPKHVQDAEYEKRNEHSNKNYSPTSPVTNTKGNSMEFFQKNFSDYNNKKFMPAFPSTRQTGHSFKNTSSNGNASAPKAMATTSTTRVQLVNNNKCTIL